VADCAGRCLCSATVASVHHLVSNPKIRRLRTQHVAGGAHFASGTLRALGTPLAGLACRLTRRCRRATASGSAPCPPAAGLGASCGCSARPGTFVVSLGAAALRGEHFLGPTVTIQLCIQFRFIMSRAGELAGNAADAQLEAVDLGCRYAPRTVMVEVSPRRYAPSASAKCAVYQLRPCATHGAPSKRTPLQPRCRSR
jgi:hypothetical protein